MDGPEDFAREGDGGRERAAGKTAPGLVAEALGLAGGTRECRAHGAGDVLEESELAGRLRDNFARIDANGDAEIDGREIRRAKSSGEFAGEDAQLLFVLERSFESLRRLSDDDEGSRLSRVLSGGDVDELARLLQGRSPDRMGSGAEDTQYALLDIRESLKEAQQAAAYVARSGQAIAESGLPGASAVRQGQIGDCFLISAIAAVVSVDPAAFSKMIADNGDGTYTVRFPGADPVVVTAPSEAELLWGASGGESGFWPHIIERAYAQVGQRAERVAQSAYYEDGLFGGNSAVALSILTGREAQQFSTYNTSAEEMHQILARAVADKRPLVAGTPMGLGRDDLGLPRQHAYTVLDYNRETRTVTIRNPYGRTEPGGDNPLDGLDDGVFVMPLDQFMRHFESLTEVVSDDPARRLRPRPSFG